MYAIRCVSTTETREAQGVKREGKAVGLGRDGEENNEFQIKRTQHYLGHEKYLRRAANFNHWRANRNQVGHFSTTTTQTSTVQTTITVC